jgi:hypothetical protein
VLPATPPFPLLLEPPAAGDPPWPLGSVDSLLLQPPEPTATPSRTKENRTRFEIGAFDIAAIIAAALLPAAN